MYQSRDAVHDSDCKALSGRAHGPRLTYDTFSVRFITTDVALVDERFDLHNAPAAPEQAV